MDGIDFKKLMMEYSEEFISGYQNKNAGSLFDWNQKSIEEFKNIPIETLLLDPYFLNLSGTIYDGVFQDIVDLWAEREKRPVNLALFLEGIGSGKSVKAAIILWLLWYELSMHQSPQEYFGLIPNSMLAIMMLSRTESQSRRVCFQYTWNHFQSGFNKDYFPASPKYSREIRVERNNTCIFPGTSSALSALGYNVYCLGGDTKLQLADGNSVQLRDLEGCGPIDLIGFKDNNFTPTKAKTVVNSGEKELFEIEMEDGSILKATADHRVLVYKSIRKKRQKGSPYKFFYKEVQDLTKEDELVTQKDFITCQITGRLITQITSSYLKGLDYTMDQYKKEFPHASLVSPLIKERIGRVRTTKYPHGSRGFGWEHSAEVKEKIRKGNLGKPCNLKTREAVSKALKGGKLSKEHRAKISLAGQKENNPFYGKKHSLETRAQISKSRRKSPTQMSPAARARMSKKFSGKGNPRYGKPPTHGKRIEYKGVKFRSSWEVKVAKFLDSQEIEWQYESHSIEGPGFTYTPDFYLPLLNRYIEVKGYFRSDKAREKFEFAKKSLDIFLVMKKEIKDLNKIKRFLV